jgi:UDP-N-acetylmuramate dehydrogenase
MDLISRLPKVRGQYRENAVLAKTNWFGVGGPAEVLFRPKDTDDLAGFLRSKPDDIDITVIGIGSNLLVRDGGIDGVVIKLGRGFTEVKIHGELLEAGAGALNYNVVNFAKEHCRSGIEFIVGIPGSIGGALAMNAGCYGAEISDILEYAEALDSQGNIHKLHPKDIGYIYRGNTLHDGWIFTKTYFKTSIGERQTIEHTINEIVSERTISQPIKERTSGSTFTNPSGHKAWKLIDEAGCRGLKVGGAQVSEKHCNFFVNTGDATAADIEALGEEVRKRVKQKSGVQLEWEIKRIGKRKVSSDDK